MGRGRGRRRWKRGLKSRRLVCRFWILSGWLLACVPAGVQSQETKSKAASPAPSATSAAKPAPAKAAAPEDGPDDEFLEFLGSVDSDATDEDWLDYLARTDVLKVGKAKKKAPAAAQTRSAPDKAGK